MRKNLDRLLWVLTNRIDAEVFEYGQSCLEFLLWRTAGCLPYAVRIIEHAARIAKRRGESTIKFDLINTATGELTHNILDRLSGEDYAFLFLLGTSERRAVIDAHPEKLAEMIQSGAVVQYSRKSVRVLPPIIDHIAEYPNVLAWPEAKPYAAHMAKLISKTALGRDWADHKMAFDLTF